MNNILEFILSGQILMAIIFGSIGYVVLDYFIGFWAYIISLCWNDKIYDYNNYKKFLTELDIIKMEGDIISESKNYVHYMDIILERASISRILKSIISLIIFFSICLISYNIGNKTFHYILLIFCLNVFINLIFATVKLRQIKMNNEQLIKDLK